MGENIYDEIIYFIWKNYEKNKNDSRKEKLRKTIVEMH